MFKSLKEIVSLLTSINNHLAKISNEKSVIKSNAPVIFPDRWESCGSPAKRKGAYHND